MYFSGDEYCDDECTSGLSTIEPWYLLAPIDEATGEEDEREAQAHAGDTGGKVGANLPVHRRVGRKRGSCGRDTTTGG
jgi:hypothetical protein